jgi:hypothetical protein
MTIQNGGDFTPVPASDGESVQRWPERDYATWFSAVSSCGDTSVMATIPVPSLL